MHPHRSIILVLLGLLVVGCEEHKTPPAPRPSAPPAVPKPPPYVVVPGKKPVPGIKRVLIVTIDGGRPDLVLRASMPNLRALMEQGTFTFWARTINEAETLPAHTSIVTGVVTEKHGISWNTHIEDSYPKVPTIFELAKKNGYSTSMVTGKTKFIAFRKPETIDWCWITETEPTQDLTVAEEAVKILKNHRPEVMLVHFPNSDDLAHWYGWGSAQHMQILERADRALGLVVDCLKELKLFDSTCILVTADHGGQGYSHWGGDERSRYVPWIACGPGIRKNFDLTLQQDRQVMVTDTFATACALLAIPYSAEVDGAPVLEILESSNSVGPSPYLDHQPKENDPAQPDDQK